MSWHGFKKVINRAGIQIMQKAGAMEKTSDAEFEAEERNLKQYEKRIHAAQKRGKHVLDAMHVLCSVKLTEDLEKLGLDEGQEMPRYKEMWSMLETLVNSELDPAYRQVLLQPTVKLGEAVKKTQESMKKRANKLLDYDQARSRARNAKDGKLESRQRDEMAAKRAFEQLDDSLRHDLPILYESTDGILRDSSKAASRLETVLLQEIVDGLAYIPDAPNPTTTQNDMHGTMEQIKSLRIASAY